jgi:hypothetical protein
VEENNKKEEGNNGNEESGLSDYDIDKLSRIETLNQIMQKNTIK